MKKMSNVLIDSTNGNMIITEATTLQRDVIITSISCDRVTVRQDIKNDLYSASWSKDIVLTKNTQRALLAGLDNYICDLSSVLYSAEDDEEEIDNLIPINKINVLLIESRRLYHTIELLL